MLPVNGAVKIASKNETLITEQMRMNLMKKVGVIGSSRWGINVDDKKKLTNLDRDNPAFSVRVTTLDGTPEGRE